MADEVYIYIIKLPPGIHEIVTPCADGYTVYLSAADTAERRIRSYRHALLHIENMDFEKKDVNRIEDAEHRKG